MIDNDLMVVSYETDDTLSTLSSLSANYNILNSMSNNNVKGSLLSQALLRYNIRNASNPDLVASLESDNYFEYSNVTPSMEGISTTIWNMIKAIIKKIVDFMKMVSNWIKTNVSKAKPMKEAAISYLQELSKKKWVEASNQYQIETLYIRPFSIYDNSIEGSLATLSFYSDFISMFNHILTNKFELAINHIVSLRENYNSVVDNLDEVIHQKYLELINQNKGFSIISVERNTDSLTYLKVMSLKGLGSNLNNKTVGIVDAAKPLVTNAINVFNAIVNYQQKWSEREKVKDHLIRVIGRVESYGKTDLSYLKAKLLTLWDNCIKSEADVIKLALETAKEAMRVAKELAQHHATDTI